MVKWSARVCGVVRLEVRCCLSERCLISYYIIKTCLWFAKHPNSHNIEIHSHAARVCSQDRYQPKFPRCVFSIPWQILRFYFPILSKSRGLFFNPWTNPAVFFSFLHKSRGFIPRTTVSLESCGLFFHPLTNPAVCFSIPWPIPRFVFPSPDKSSGLFCSYKRAAKKNHWIFWKL